MTTPTTSDIQEPPSLFVNVKPIPIRRLLALDLEWSMTKDKYGEHTILSAGFVDSDGKKLALLTEDFVKEYGEDKAEKALLLKIVNIIIKYDWSVGFYSTGVRAYNQHKRKMVGRDSDLIQLHRCLQRWGIMSVINQGVFTKIPYIRYNNHTHLDAYLLFTNQVIKTSVYNGQYSANDLDTISKAIIKRGKYKSWSGSNFESIISLEEKRKYVLEDAQLLMDCISHNNFELLHIVNAISTLTGVPFRDVCRARGVVKIWTPVLDRITLKELSKIEQLIEEHSSNRTLLSEEELSSYANRYKKLLEYYKRPEFGTSSSFSHSKIDPIEDQESDDADDDEDPNNNNPRYIGGWVLDPRPGQYYNVYVFDVASLYPSMVIENNISFDTVNCSCCKDNQFAKVPDEVLNDTEIVVPILSSNNIKLEVTMASEYEKPHEPRNWWICIMHKGLFRNQTKEYTQERLKCKTLVDDSKLSNVKRKYTEDQLRDFETKSRAYKILLNGGYGTFEYNFAKYEDLATAELIVRYGRYTIRKIIEIANSMFGWDSIYSDTDSVFSRTGTVYRADCTIMERKEKEEAQQQKSIHTPTNGCQDSFLFEETNCDLFLDTCNLQLNIRMELDKIYDRLVLVHKKNYVGITRPTNKSKSKSLVVRGLAGKKSDRCLWVRQCFTRMVEDYMNNVNPCIRLRQEVMKLETGKLDNPENDLLMHKNLGQNPEDYHTNVTQKLIGLEKNLQDGDTARYYMADNERKYTFNVAEYSVTKYRDSLMKTVTPFLSLLGYDTQKHLQTFDSLYEVVRREMRNRRANTNDEKNRKGPHEQQHQRPFPIQI